MIVPFEKVNTVKPLNIEHLRNSGVVCCSLMSVKILQVFTQRNKKKVSAERNLFDIYEYQFW